MATRKNPRRPMPEFQEHYQSAQKVMAEHVADKHPKGGWDACPCTVNWLDTMAPGMQEAIRRQIVESVDELHVGAIESKAMITEMFIVKASERQQWEYIVLQDYFEQVSALTNLEEGLNEFLSAFMRRHVDRN